MDFQQLLAAMTPSVYQSMKRAVEIGKWPDKRPLTEAERHTCLQAMLAYEARSDFPEAQRTGYIDSSGCPGARKAR